VHVHSSSGPARTGNGQLKTLRINGLGRLAAYRRTENTSVKLIGSTGDSRRNLTASEKYGKPGDCPTSSVTDTRPLKTRNECKLKWNEHTLAQCTWLPVTMRCPSISITQFKLQAMFAFWFACKHIVVNTCHISWSMGIRKIPTASDLQDHWYWCHSTGYMRCRPPL